MNFKVHRRNKSLAVTAPPSEPKERRSLRKVTHHDPLPETLLTRAKAVYHSQTNLPEAISLFQQYLTTNSHCSEALYLCGVCLLRVGQPEEALTHLRVVSDSYPGKPNAMLLEAMALNKLGSYLVMEGRGQAALTTANECVRRFPRFEEGLCFRGKLLLGMAKFQQAEHDFSVLAGRPESSFLTHNALGDCYRAQSRPEKALSSYVRALEMLEGGEESLLREVKLKIGVCLYQLERWEDALRILETAADKNCDCYYYIGSCEAQLSRREQAILHLEYCLRLQGRPVLMTRAYKQLLQLHLAEGQFYEAREVVELGRQAGITPNGWANVVESFMAIIKGHYEAGLRVLSEVWVELKAKEESKKKGSMKRDSSQSKPRYAECNTGLVPRAKEKKLRYFSTKSVLKAMPKISSTRVPVPKEEPPSSLSASYSLEEKELMVPLILKFKAYGEFFTNKLFSCLDSYEEYETFMKDVFGKDSDVLYNKQLCEGLLMADNEMFEEAMAKYSTCIQIYQQNHGQVPLEPILYKVCLLVKAALTHTPSPPQEGTDIPQGPHSDRTSVLRTVLELMDSYGEELQKCSLGLYFRALILVLLSRLEESNQWLERSLKAAEDCSWKWLWAKGVIETRLGNYHEAIKEFSAGLILESRGELYLGRAIAFMLLSEATLDPQAPQREMGGSLRVRGDGERSKGTKGGHREQLVENCFEDLQKYIELESDQEQISLWVSKVLFANAAYEEAARSVGKIKAETEEVRKMREAVAIFEGDFKEGGELGVAIQSSFEGLFVPAPATESFGKWLIALNLYTNQEYPALLKHLQRELFQSDQAADQALLRFNVAVVYLLLSDKAKAINALKGLLGKDDPLQVAQAVQKLEQLAFYPDECFQELREELDLGPRLLSSYLAYRSVNISQQLRIYVRPSIPFPQFERPSLDLWLGEDWVLGEVSVQAVERRVEAPWIRRGQNDRVQFTSELQESGWLGESSSLRGRGELSEKGDFSFA